MDQKPREWPPSRENPSTSRSSSKLSEEERFARIIQGRSLDDVKPWFLKWVDQREVLEFLAGFSPEHARQLRELQATEAETNGRVIAAPGNEAPITTRSRNGATRIIRARAHHRTPVGSPRKGPAPHRAEVRRRGAMAAECSPLRMTGRK